MTNVSAAHECIYSGISWEYSTNTNKTNMPTVHDTYDGIFLYSSTNTQIILQSVLSEYGNN